VVLLVAKYVGDQLPLKKNEKYKVHIGYDDEDFIHLSVVNLSIKRVYDEMGEFEKEWEIK
jgi:hypothetical protein